MIWEELEKNYVTNVITITSMKIIIVNIVMHGYERVLG